MADKIQDFEVNSPRWLSLEDFEGEIWKTIPCFDGSYLASNMGRIKSIDRYITHTDKNGITFTRHFRSVVRWVADNGHGYLVVTINKKRFYVHRLVCLTFLPNPHNKTQIDHIDTNTYNNCIFNLKWASPAENCNNILTTAKRKLANSNPIVALDYFGNYVTEFSSAADAAKKLSVQSSVIKDIISNNRSARTTKGLQFVRKSVYDKDKDYSLLLKKSRNSSDNLPTLKMVILLDSSYKIDTVYPNTMIASKCFNCSTSLVSKRCRKQLFADGFHWIYLKDAQETLKGEAIEKFFSIYRK